MLINKKDIKREKYAIATDPTTLRKVTIPMWEIQSKTKTKNNNKKIKIKKGQFQFRDSKRQKYPNLSKPNKSTKAKSNKQRANNKIPPRTTLIATR